MQTNILIFLPHCFIIPAPDTWLPVVGGGIANLSCSAFVSDSF